MLLPDLLRDRSERDIADACSVTRQTARTWKYGATPHPKHFTSIAKLLGVEVHVISTAVIAQATPKNGK